MKGTYPFVGLQPTHIHDFKQTLKFRIQGLPKSIRECGGHAN